MKNILLLVCFIAFGLDSISQDDSTSVNKHKLDEIYLFVNNFSPITTGITFKNQLGNQNYLKISLADLRFESGTTRPSSSLAYSVDNTVFSLGLSAGYEMRKSLFDQLSLYHGPNFSMIYTFTSNKEDNPSIRSSQRAIHQNEIDFSIPYTIGLLFDITDQFLIAVELNPRIGFSHLSYEDKRPSTNGSDYSKSTPYLNAGISNADVAVAYRF